MQNIFKTYIYVLGLQNEISSAESRVHPGRIYTSLARKGLNEWYTVRKVSVCGFFLVRIQSECGKMRTGKTPNTDTFHPVVVRISSSIKSVWNVYVLHDSINHTKRFEHEPKSLMCPSFKGFKKFLKICMTAEFCCVILKSFFTLLYHKSQKFAATKLQLIHQDIRENNFHSLF